MSSTSYVDVRHEGGPLGGQTLRYAGEPSLRRSGEGGVYVRERQRGDQGQPLRAYVYRWEPASEQVAQVAQDGDQASAMLAGAVESPAETTVAAPAVKAPARTSTKTAKG